MLKIDLDAPTPSACCAACAKISGMSEPTSPQPNAHAAPARGSDRIVHRVCTQCNQMFPVTPDRFDAKQCPNCHKG
jgi:hypothetical protein